MLSQETKFEKLAHEAMKLQTSLYYLAKGYPVTKISQRLEAAASTMSDVITNVNLAKTYLQ